MRINVAFNGMGKMGTAVAELLLKDKDVSLVDVIDPNPSTERGKEIQQDGRMGGLEFLRKSFDLNVEQSGLVESKNFNVLVDFSNPEACLKACLTAAKNKINIVSGTVPVAKSIEEKIRDAVYENNIYGIRCPNFSVGVQYFLHDIKSMAIDPSEDISVHEIHRMEKKSTSGTAGLIARELCTKAEKTGYILTTEGKAFDKDNNEIEMPEWKKELLRNYVKVSQQRFGDEPGTHIVKVGDEENYRQYEVRATRSSLADGAFRSVKYLAEAAENKLEPGMYTIEDVLFGSDRA